MYIQFASSFANHGFARVCPRLRLFDRDSTRMSGSGARTCPPLPSRARHKLVWPCSIASNHVQPAKARGSAGRSCADRVNLPRFVASQCGTPSFEIYTRIRWSPFIFYSTFICPEETEVYRGACYIDLLDEEIRNGWLCFVHFFVFD